VRTEADPIVGADGNPAGLSGERLGGDSQLGKIDETGTLDLDTGNVVVPDIASEPGQVLTPVEVAIGQEALLAAAGDLVEIGEIVGVGVERFEDVPAY
jgi:hypothetical protein